MINMRKDAYQANNTEFNPLYEKMKERFCQNGTIAEQIVMISRTNRRKKNHRASTDYSLTNANSLPENKRTVTAPRRFFTLRNINAACMLLLIAGTLLFSGAAVGSIYEKQAAEPLAISGPTTEERMILNDAIPGATPNDSICGEYSFLL